MRCGAYQFRDVWRLGLSYQSWTEGRDGPTHRLAEVVLGYWHGWVSNEPRETSR